MELTNNVSILMSVVLVVLTAITAYFAYQGWAKSRKYLSGFGGADIVSAPTWEDSLSGKELLKNFRRDYTYALAATGLSVAIGALLLWHRYGVRVAIAYLGAGALLVVLGGMHLMYTRNIGRNLHTDGTGLHESEDVDVNRSMISTAQAFIGAIFLVALLGLVGGIWNAYGKYNNKDAPAKITEEAGANAEELNKAAGAGRCNSTCSTTNIYDASRGWNLQAASA